MCDHILSPTFICDQIDGDAAEPRHRALFDRVEGAVKAALREDDMGLELGGELRRHMVCSVPLQRLEELPRRGLHHFFAVVEQCCPMRLCSCCYCFLASDRPVLLRATAASR